MADIDKKTFILLTESMLVNLVSKMGQGANFISELGKLKKPIEVNIKLIVLFVLRY